MDAVGCEGASWEGRGPSAEGIIGHASRRARARAGAKNPYGRLPLSPIKLPPKYTLPTPILMIAYATTAVTYGVCVQAADLVVADEAFALLQPAAPALEMSTFAGIGAPSGAVSALGRVPTEVWDIFQGHRTGLCVLGARRAMHEEECFACHQDLRTRASASSMLAPDWLFHVGNHGSATSVR